MSGAPLIFYLEFLPLAKGEDYELEAPESYAAKLTVRGSISMDNSAELALAARTLLSGGVKSLILNMEHLSYIDSSGIGLMIRLRKLSRSLNSEFVLLNVPPRIKEAFDLVNLKEYVNSFYSEEKAIEYFRSRKEAV